MKTEITTLKQMLQVWAIPLTVWEIKQSPEKLPFSYEVKTNKPWEEGAVKIHETEISIVIPGGIDITKAAIETLKEAQKEVKLKAEKKVTELTERINSLLMLEYQSDEYQNGEQDDSN